MVAVLIGFMGAGKTAVGASSPSVYDEAMSRLRGDEFRPMLSRPDIY
jgi:hypothetical protein